MSRRRKRTHGSVADVEADAHMPPAPRATPHERKVRSLRKLVSREVVGEVESDFAAIDRAQLLARLFELEPAIAQLINREVESLQVELQKLNLSRPVIERLLDAVCRTANVAIEALRRCCVNTFPAGLAPVRIDTLSAKQKRDRAPTRTAVDGDRVVACVAVYLDAVRVIMPGRRKVPMVAASIERADGVVEVFAFSHDDSLLLVKGFAGCLIEHGHKTAKHLFGNIIWPEE